MIWSGGAIPEPEGERLFRYEAEAKRMIKRVVAKIAEVDPAPSSLRTLTAEEWESPAWRAVIDKIVPAIDREGLNEDEHCCEWSLCMDRERIRRELLAVLPDDWIAVSERLPEPGKMVLCLIQFMEGDGDYRHVVTHDFGETRVTEHGDYISPHCFQSHMVTHWMPLRGAPDAAIAKQEGGLAQGNEG